MTRETLHRLVDELDERDVPTAARVLEALRQTAGEGDAVLWSLENAPLDDEPETEEERAAVAEALAETELIPHEELKRQLGLTE